MEGSGDFSVLEYLYRDAGNYKTHGSVLLAGRATPNDAAAIRASLDDVCFVAEQVGIAPLQPRHLRECGEADGLDHGFHEADGLDHGFHEFANLGNVEAGQADGAAEMTVAELVRRFRLAADRWNPALSPFGDG